MSSFMPLISFCIPLTFSSNLSTLRLSQGHTAVSRVTAFLCCIRDFCMCIRLLYILNRELQFGESPWLADGSVNPSGVPYCRASDRVLAKEMHLDDYETRGFACRKCGAMVRITPRAFGGAKEPVDWWWCRACQGEYAATASLKTVKQKRAAQAASGCRRLEVAWGKAA